MPLGNLHRKSRFLHWRILSLLFILIGSLAPSAFGQTTADGKIHGHISDSTGAVLPNVKVSARSPAVGGTFNATADNEGNYRLTDLPAGDNYSVQADVPGFSKFERNGLLVRAA